jgi:replicative DNA helicase
MGKTALALNIAQAAADSVVVGFFSLEMSRTELMIRLLTATGRLDSHRVMSGKLHAGELQRLGTARSEVGALKLIIDDTSSLSVMGIRGKARRLKQKRGLGLVIVDYLQLLSSDRRYDSRVVEVGAMSRALKQLAKELEVPILCLAQLNRGPEARSDGRPKLSDLRESGSLEQDADLVLLLHRPEEYQKTPDNAGLAELIIAKHRNGPTDLVTLRWSREQTRFDNWSARKENYQTV